MNDYNRIAGVYDTLARLTFRGNILNSQTHYIQGFMPNERILIIGGGSGEVLTAMEQLNMPLVIDFIEPSERMIEKARERMIDSSNLEVTFHQTTFESFPSSDKYDWVCCFYFLDLFKPESLQLHINHIKKLMHSKSHLLVSDFQIKNATWWKRILSQIMHQFFKITTRLESNRLKDIDKMIIDSGFRKTTVTHFFSRFIFSAIYQKEVL